MRKIKGKDFMMFVDQGGSYRAVAASTACGIEVSEESIPVLSSESWMWQHIIGGKKSWAVEVEAYVDTDYDTFSLLDQIVRVMVGTAPDNYISGSREPDGWIRRYGDAIVTELVEEAQVDGLTLYRMRLVGTGELKHDSSPITSRLWYDYELWNDSENWNEQ